jgi:hypothetical protein
MLGELEQGPCCAQRASAGARDLRRLRGGNCPNAPREVRARRRGRPTRCLVALTRRAHPRRSRAPDRAASTASSSTSPPTTWTSRRSRSSSRRSRRTTAPSCS